jgi:uncharacterized protein (DUF305 family)
MKCNILKKNIINDKDFLETMIIHHQVAIDMSKQINKSSNNDVILEKARSIIFNQTIEINYMKTLYNKNEDIVNTQNTQNKVLNNSFRSEYPSIFKNLKCDESHFNLSHHDMNDMTDLQYVSHMISHHNTALELSKLIIMSTKNSKILILAQIINLSQSKEIFELYFLEKSLNHNWRNLLKPFNV